MPKYDYLKIIAEQSNTIDELYRERDFIYENHVHSIYGIRIPEDLLKAPDFKEEIKNAVNDIIRRRRFSTNSWDVHIANTEKSPCKCNDCAQGKGECGCYWDTINKSFECEGVTS